MSVVQPDADLLVLTETGYGKRVALDRVPAQAPRRPGRPPDHPRGQEDGVVAAVQQVTELDEELAPDLGRRPGRPDGDVNTINRYSAQAPAA